MSQTTEESQIANRESLLIEDFARRLRLVLAHSNVKQGDLVAHLGGYCPAFLSRLLLGQAKTLPIDFLVALCRWITKHGYSVEWLTTGQTPGPGRGCGRFAAPEGRALTQHHKKRRPTEARPGRPERKAG